MARSIAFAAVLAVCCACAPRPDPRVGAAENFKSTVFELIAQDEAQTKRLNGLSLGMTDREVLEVAGAPYRRDSRVTESGTSRETWVYNGQLSTIGTLTFENKRLVQVQTNN